MQAEPNRDNCISFAEDLRPSAGLFCRHCHTGYELLFVFEGQINMQIEDTAVAMRPGDLVIVRPTLYHVASVRSDGTYRRAVINVSRAYLEEAGFPTLAPLLDSLPCCFSLQQGSFLMQHYEKAAEYFARFPAPEDRRQLLHSLLFSIYAALSSADAVAPVDQRSPLSPITRRVLSYIEQNLSGDLTLEALSARLRVSKSHMGNLFSREMGIGISRYVTQKRVMLAKELIDRGLPVKEAFQRCGYHEYSTFYRAHMAVFGVNPTYGRRTRPEEEATGDASAK